MGWARSAAEALAGLTEGCAVEGVPSEDMARVSSACMESIRMESAALAGAAGGAAEEAWAMGASRAEVMAAKVRGRRERCGAK